MILLPSDSANSAKSEAESEGFRGSKSAPAVLADSRGPEEIRRFDCARFSVPRGILPMWDSAADFEGGSESDSAPLSNF